MTLNLAGVVNDSIVDGPGIRCTIFAQGCSHNCPGCHNPETHCFGAGTDVSIGDLVTAVSANPLVRGVTFSGGDPFFQAEGFSTLALRLKELGFELAAWTGFLWEDLVLKGSPAQKELLSRLDTLVDGPFVLAQRDLTLRFRGSTNQRIIDVQASLAKLSADPAEPSPLWCTAKRWTGLNA